MSVYLESRINESVEYLNYYIDKIAWQTKWNLRIIYDVEIPFPLNYEWIKHDSDIEISNIPWDKHSHKGWGKPDKQFGNVEIRYLQKEFHPLTIEQWRLKIKNPK
ncbi:MAG: hypothetical protein IPJ81_06865 [Chitinophagaceae bacterium]|nr:hypothetical protein [Chitinophagaceae bacterium]